ncbi:Hsp70 family protein [Stenotrophomonas sp.]|uniref:Hsp70 family protein n=1 Tax=Stenotrophomonas sp. TaxID=69392 RepID=UPI0028A1F173|nr:Hsp70 family protein [Stenotrophomonas sp.]
MIAAIDLGTTHSLIGVHRAEGPTLFSNAHGELLTPSVVSVDGDRVLVGRPARDRLVTHPGLTVAGFKRLMGTGRDVRLGHRGFRPEELSALVLRSLLADAEAALGTRIEEAVISVPAYFSDAQRKATRVAGELAGIRVERLVNEPTAAALAYSVQDRQAEGRVLVLDLGGGTFDVSLLELFDGVVQVHASAGDNVLGGEDFLDVLVAAFCSHHRIDLRYLAPREAATLRQRLEGLKRDLGQHGTAQLQILLDGRELHWQIDEATFAGLAEPLLQRMRAPIERAMRDARLSPSDLDDIVLVGGAMRMPMATRLVTRLFGRLPLRHVPADQAVALGAAVAAGMKARDEALEERVLTDVCPYTLGIKVGIATQHSLQQGHFHPIIPRNAAVPTSREAPVLAAEDGQPNLHIEIYQGESPMAANNIKLGEIVLPLAPGRRNSGARVRFTYDVNGLLQVEATEMATGLRMEKVIEQNPGLLDPAQIAQRLASLQALKMHPREQQQNLAVLTRAERLYEQHLGLRPTLQAWIVQFRTTLDTQDPALIEPVRQRFHTAMDELESTP